MFRDQISDGGDNIKNTTLIRKLRYNQMQQNGDVTLITNKKT